jgi:hypothetical protein
MKEVSGVRHICSPNFLGFPGKDTYAMPSLRNQIQYWVISVHHCLLAALFRKRKKFYFRYLHCATLFRHVPYLRRVWYFRNIFKKNRRNKQAANIAKAMIGTVTIIFRQMVEHPLRQMFFLPRNLSSYLCSAYTFGFSMAGPSFANDEPVS